MDLLVLIDRLDDAVHEAKPVPLSNSRRMDRGELTDLLDRLAAELGRELGPPSSPAARRAADALQGLRAHVQEAGDVPLTGRARIDTETMYSGLDELRAAIPQALREVRDREQEARTITYDAATAPPLAALVERVALEDAIFRLERFGSVVAELRAPEPPRS